MARNQRRDEGQLTFAATIPAVLLFALMVACGLGIILLKQKTIRLGDQLKVVEVDLERATKETLKLESQVAELKTPRALEAKMAGWQLAMVRPSETQIRYMVDPGTADDRMLRPRMVAQADVIHPASRTP